MKSTFQMLSFLTVLSLVVTACGNTTPSVEYYTLSPLQMSAIQKPEGFEYNYAVIGIGPITVPEYLESSRIVTRSSPNKLKINEYHRWGGSLEDELLRTISENVSLLTGSEKVIVYPWKRSIRPDIHIQISFKNLEAIPGKKAVLRASWIVNSPNSRNNTRVNLSKFEKDISSSHIESIVAAQSQLIERLSLEIVNSLNGSE